MRGGGGSIVSARDAICLELQLSGGTQYYANTALHEPATYWEPRLLPDEDIVRSTDPHEGYLAALGVTVRLDNTDGAISDLLDTDTIDGATALIYRKVVSNAGVVTSTTTRLKGKCRYVGGDQLAVRIEIMPPAITDLDYFQRKINATAFPSAPDGAVAGKPSTLGLGMTAPFGYCTNSKGKVELIMINDTANAEKFGGIMGGVFDFSAVYRERADVLTLLAVTTHYVKTKYALDAEGNAHSYITLTSGTWAEGDRYFADIRGLPKECYGTLDGTNDYLALAASGSTIPGHVAATEYTLEVTFYLIAGAARRGVVTQYNTATSQYGVSIDTFDAFHRSATPAHSWVIDTPDKPTYANGRIYTARQCWKAGEIFEYWLYDHTAGTAARYTDASGVPDDLNICTTPMVVGAHGTLGYKNNCRVYRVIWAATCNVPLSTNTFKGDRTDPIEGIISEWHFSGIARVNDAGAYYVRDRVGSNHLTATSLTNSDITLASYETSGPWMLDRALRWNDYNWRLSSDLISRTSLGVLLAAFETAGYNDASGTWMAGMLPPDFGSVMETSAALREFCWALGCVPYVTPTGRLAFVDFDATTTAESANVYAEQMGHIVEARVGAPLPKWNECPRALFDRLHRNDGSWGSSAVATNQESIDNYGLAEEDAEFALIGHFDYLTPIIKRHMLKRSGKPATATIALAGYDAWAEDIGSKPEFNLPNMRGQWNERPLLLYQVEDGTWDYSPKLTGIECGAQCGSVVVTGGAGDPIETEVVVNASLDSFIGSTETWCGGTTPYTDGNDNAGYGTLGYQRHGHWYGYITICAGPDYNLGYGDINWRAPGRFPFAGWAGRTIISVESELVIEVPSMIYHWDVRAKYKQNWNGGAIHRCLITDWDNTDTYNGIRSPLEPIRWNDGTCVGANLGTLASGAGTKSVIFNAAGIAYVQAACNGTGDPAGGGTNVNLTLQGMANGQYWSACKITGWKLRVVYV